MESNSIPLNIFDIFKISYISNRILIYNIGKKNKKEKSKILIERISKCPKFPTIFR